MSQETSPAGVSLITSRRTIAASVVLLTFPVIQQSELSLGRCYRSADDLWTITHKGQRALMDQTTLCTPPPDPPDPPRPPGRTCRLLRARLQVHDPRWHHLEHHNIWISQQVKENNLRGFTSCFLLCCVCCSCLNRLIVVLLSYHVLISTIINLLMKMLTRNDGKCFE